MKDLNSLKFTKGCVLVKTNQLAGPENKQSSLQHANERQRVAFGQDGCMRSIKNGIVKQPSPIASMTKFQLASSLNFETGVEWTGNSFKF